MNKLEEYKNMFKDFVRKNPHLKSKELLVETRKYLVELNSKGYLQNDKFGNYIPSEVTKRILDAGITQTGNKEKDLENLVKAEESLLSLCREFPILIRECNFNYTHENPLYDFGTGWLELTPNSRNALTNDEMLAAKRTTTLCIPCLKKEYPHLNLEKVLNTGNLMIAGAIGAGLGYAAKSLIEKIF